MHRLMTGVFCSLLFSAYGAGQISKVDISGDWQNGPPENPNPTHYHLTQQGDNLTSDDATYGHAVGHFTSPNQIVMKWPSAEWTAYVNSDQIIWNNNSSWLRRGEVAVSSVSLAVNAGQANGSPNPDCYPAGGAQCGWLVINDISPSGPSGEVTRVGIASQGRYDYQASYSGILGSGTCEGKVWGFDCKHWAIFDDLDNLSWFKQGNGKWGFKIRFKNWASKPQTATFAVQYWKWTP
jgi:hypothetical protein